MCDNSDGSTAQQGFDWSYDVFVEPASGQEMADNTRDLALLCADLRMGVLEHVDTAQVPMCANGRLRAQFQRPPQSGRVQGGICECGCGA